MIDPIVLDLDGNGIELISREDSGVFFDMDGDGIRELTGWVSSTDGLLAIDGNGNGTIDEINELIGNLGQSGFAELITHDVNGDDVIDSGDAVWSSLRVWVDADGDGVTDAGELKTMAQLGIRAIDLNYTTVNFTAEGNRIHEQSIFEYTDGSTGLAADIWFDVSNVATHSQVGATGNITIDALPDIRGRGDVESLRSAMLGDSALVTLVSGFVNLQPNQLGNARAQVEQILYRWAEVQSVDPASRGAFFDGRKLAALEAFLGTDFFVQGSANPNNQAVASLTAAWNGLVEGMMARLLIGGTLGDVLAESIVYIPELDRLLTVQAPEELFASLAAAVPARDGLVVAGYWAAVLPLARETAQDVGVDTAANAYRAVVNDALTPFGLMPYADLLTAGIQGIGSATSLSASGVYRGTSSANVLTVSAAGAAVYGDGGDDRIVGTNTSYSSKVLLDGGAGNDQLQGGAGNDWVDGGIGIDIMAGGDGNDTYSVDSASDFVLEAGGYGTDTVRSTLSYTLGATLENLILLGDAGLNGFGNASSNQLTGNSGANLLEGYGYHDLLDGGAGNDTLRGGDGNDTYVVDGLGDVVSEAGDGYDVVRSAVDYSVGSRVERLELTGTALKGTGNSLHNVLVGNAGANTLTGGAGEDSMYGGAGDDSYYVDNGYDRVYENTGEGIDTVRSSASFALGSHVEHLILTGTLAINGDGNDMANEIYGNAADNQLNGRVGADRLSGGRGNDTYYVDNAGDKVVEVTDAGEDWVMSGLADYTLGSHVENLWLSLVNYDSAIRSGSGNALNNQIVGLDGSNVIRGLDGDDRLYGNGGTDTLFGGDGNDLLEGGLDLDSLSGGDGNDTYHVNLGDVVAELANSGTDLVLAYTSYALSANTENLTAAQDYNNVSLTGNGLANVITGNNSANWLDGGFGADTLIGGAGDDTYVLENIGDVVSDYSGYDTVRSSRTYVLANDLEALVLTGTGAVDGTGNGWNNQLTGNSGVNRLYGLAGEDRLDGGIGADRLEGGLGRDTYVVDNAGDVVIDAGGDEDWVYASINYVLAERLDHLWLTGTAVNGTGNALRNVLEGNDVANLLDGGEGGDTLIGGLGDDTYVVDSYYDNVREYNNEGTDTVRSTANYSIYQYSIENLILLGSDDVYAEGNSLANSLTGNSGANTFYGLGGADTMTGGLGDDTYMVEDATDLAVENVDAGTEWINTTLTAYTLGANLENLWLGIGSLDTVARSGTGNTLANHIQGSNGVNTLSGLDGDDRLEGFAGADSLLGGNGNDSHDGGTGADTMAGGLGDDTYVVNEAGDVVTEAANAGTDTVLSAVSFILSTNLEHLTLTGSAVADGQGNALANTLIGNSAANNLDGGVGADIMWGGGGNDTYTVDNVGDFVLEAPSDGIDTVRSNLSYTLGLALDNMVLLGTGGLTGTGNELNNNLAGNSGANLLDGLTGTDTMTGGAGNDTYVIDSAGEVVTELVAGGTDYVRSAVNLTLSANVEHLVMTGTGNLTGNGNELVNRLTGNAAHNRLDGKAGADVMLGRAGDDTYFVDDAGDAVTEDAGEGTDVVNASVTYTLGVGEIETLILTGTAVIDGTGNTFANTLTGNGVANTLNGGAGDDTLTGGSGADVFLFGLGSGLDTINDFSASQNDTININAHSNGVVNGGGVTVSQSGTSALIDLGGGNVIVVLNTLATNAAFLSHIVW